MLVTSLATPSPCHDTPSGAAWHITIALISRTDFDQREPAIVLGIEEVFAGAESRNHECLKEAGMLAAAFMVTKYQSSDFEESGYANMPIFAGLAYRAESCQIESFFNPYASPYLKHLQRGIRYLYGKRKLTPANLTKLMKAVAPLVEFDMEESQSYKQPFLNM